jgi:hypothetical protein
LTAKHSVLTRANGVRLPAGPRSPISGSAKGRPLRSERRNPDRVGPTKRRFGGPVAGGSGNPLRVPGCRIPGPGAPIGDRPMAGPQVLTLSIEVRVLVPERILHCATKQLSDNRIVDDARGRAPPRPQHALVADLVMAPARRAGDAGSIPDEGTIDSGTLKGFQPSRDGLREAEPRCARRDQLAPMRVTAPGGPPRPCQEA